MEIFWSNRENSNIAMDNKLAPKLFSILGAPISFSSTGDGQNLRLSKKNN